MVHCSCTSSPLPFAATLPAAALRATLSSAGSLFCLLFPSARVAPPPHWLGVSPSYLRVRACAPLGYWLYLHRLYRTYLLRWFALIKSISCWMLSRQLAVVVETVGNGNSVIRYPCASSAVLYEDNRDVDITWNIAWQFAISCTYLIGGEHYYSILFYAVLSRQCISLSHSSTLIDGEGAEEERKKRRAYAYGVAVRGRR
jgi:hypothetical protein